jgi:hypothetical protein
LISRKWLMNFGPQGMMGTDPNRVRTPIVWAGPMYAPRGCDPGFASGGDDPQIGYLTENGADYVISGNAQALASMRSEANWSGNCTYHWRDNAGLPLNIIGLSLRLIGDTNGTVFFRDFHYTPPTDPEMPIVDSAHMKPLAALQHMLTDDPFFLEEMHGAVDFHHMWNGNRRYSHHLQGMMYDGETRAYAWGLRDLFYASVCTPAVTPSWLRPKSYFENALTGDNVTYSTGYLNSPARLHKLFRVWTASNAISTWTCSWLSAVTGHIAMTYPQWRPIFEWSIGMQLGFTNGTSGWCKGAPSQYIVYPMRFTGPTDPHFLNTTFLIPDTSLDSITCTDWADMWAFCVAGSNGLRVGDPDPAKVAAWDGNSLVSAPLTGTPQYYLDTLSALAQAANYNKAFGTVPTAQGCYDWLHAKLLIADHAAQYGSPPGQAKFSVDPA